jgi:hypothetical protein
MKNFSLFLQAAPPPPALPNGNLTNGIAKPNNIITPPVNNNHAGLLKEIETGKFLTHFVLNILI